MLISQDYSGCGVRVIINGALGFSHTNDITPFSLKRAIESALNSARSHSSFKKSKKILKKALLAKGDFNTDTRDSVMKHDIKEKIELVIKTDEYIRNLSPMVISSAVSYSEYIDEKYIFTTDGARAHIFTVKPEFHLKAIAEKDGEMQTASEASGITGGWDVLFTKRPEVMAEEAVKNAVDLLSAPYPPGGISTCVLEPSLVGLISHEAIGHTVEADHVLAGSIVRGRIGEQVASEKITLCDSGISEHLPYAGGTIIVDDEGVPADKTILIKDGILTGYLHNRETAEIFNVEPTGNARAFEYSDIPLIRMRNTYIEPGESSFDELIDDIKDGYLLRGAGGGQADMNAEFMFGVQRVYEIKNGKIRRLMRGVTMSGQAFEVLKSVDGVSKDFEWGLGSGHCGKMQFAKVDGGGPYIRCRVLLGGEAWS